MQVRYYTQKRSEEIKAILFSFFIIGLFFTLCIVAVSSSGALILGTEMNANGQVEYLCLMNGCENFADFHWSDK